MNHHQNYTSKSTSGVDVIEGQGCEEHNAQPIASIVPIPISKEINVLQPFNIFFACSCFYFEHVW